jgi:hypothetical protein
MHSHHIKRFNILATCCRLTVPAPEGEPGWPDIVFLGGA